MTSQRYRIVLNGAVAKGHDVAAVKRNLASLFKTDAMTIDRVFSGRRAVIKQGLDAEQALQYVSALAQAGLRPPRTGVKQRGGGGSSPQTAPRRPQAPFSIPLPDVHRPAPAGQ